MLRNAISALSASVEDMTWTPRGLWQLPRGFSLHRRRTDSVTNKRPLTRNSPSVDLRPATEERDIENPESTRTGGNVLRFTLETLSTVSSNIPFGSVLSGVIEPLLNIADRIELTSDNTQGFVQLAARVQLLLPLVSKMARDKPEQGGPFVDALKGELQSITDALKDADSRGKLDQFFNSEDNASSIAQHNNRLAQMIADVTLSKVDEVLQWLQDAESRIGANSGKAEDTRRELFGGTGGKGGHGGHTGGEGGLGEAALLATEDVNRFSQIHGGIGGEGGPGSVTGGRGGIGQGPRISHPMLPFEGNDLPRSMLAEFCQEYTLSGDIQKLLRNEGFETVASFSTVYDKDLKEAGFKLGQRAELKRALNDFAKQGSAK